MLSFIFKSQQPRQLTCIESFQPVISSPISELDDKDIEMIDIHLAAASATIISTNRMGDETKGVVVHNGSAYQTTFDAPAEPLESRDAAACQDTSPEPNTPFKRFTYICPDHISPDHICPHVFARFTSVLGSRFSVLGSRAYVSRAIVIRVKMSEQK
jgi:hypothetical protein